uniref:30S ribosomal protein S17, chloroplastic n=1 Tax=Fabrea salina TaxID=342563 RepID=A0A7S3I9J5_9CILI|mmetsp:Transcript_1929/g.3085  ORF Transcript_1929/g.3085 Transcript_1929/m.3085 type:complete len:108 (+) Transcript_1929:19-342(+)
MSALRNLLNPLKTKNIPLVKSGGELYGTVIRTGTNAKTVTVQVERFFYNQKYKRNFSRPNRFQVHDEEEFCRVGDKVVIRACRPLSKTKRYYVRNLIYMTPRPYINK